MNVKWKESMIKAGPYLAVFGVIGIAAYAMAKSSYRANSTLAYADEEVYSDYDEYDHMPILERMKNYL